MTTTPTQLSFLRATTPGATADRVRIQARIDELDVLIDKRSDQGVDTTQLVEEFAGLHRQLGKLPDPAVGWVVE